MKLKNSNCNEPQKPKFLFISQKKTFFSFNKKNHQKTQKLKLC